MTKRPSISAKPLLAYAVQEEDEGTGGIVFARSGAEARRDGAGLFGDGDFNWGRARRAQWADGYAPGPVPFKIMFEHGWWQECHGCGCRIQEGAVDDDGNEIAFDIVEVGSAVYHSPACREARLLEDAEVEHITAATVDFMSARLIKALPGVTICGTPHVYVPRGPRPLYPQQCVIYFTFPGARHGLASCRFDRIGEKPTTLVCGGDLDAFGRWCEAGYPPHLMDSPAETVQ